MQRLLKVAQESYFVGMNDKYPSHLLPPGIFELIDNGIVDSNSISKRKGTDNVADSLGAQDILGLTSYETPAGNKYVIALLNGASNAQLYYWTGAGTFVAMVTSSPSASASPSISPSTSPSVSVSPSTSISPSVSPSASISPSVSPSVSISPSISPSVSPSVSISPSPSAGDEIAKDAQMNFVQAGGKLYGFNGTQAVVIDTDLEYTLNPATIPAGKTGAWFHNHMFVANTTSNRSRLYVSNGGDPDTFTVATDHVDVNANDGDEITALYPFNNELYVFKNNTIWTISGFSSATFIATTASAQNLNNKIFGYGTPSQKSIVNTGRDLYYLSFSGSVPHFRSFNQTQFSTTLEQGVVSWDMETSLNGVNKAQLEKVSGIYDGKYIYWAMPNGASVSNDLAMVFWPKIKYKADNITYRSWVKWSGITPAQFIQSDISGQNKTYFGDATTGGFVSQLNTSSYDDNGTAVEMDVRTRSVESDRSRKTKFKYLYFKYKTGSAGSLAINARIERAVGFTSQDTISLASLTPGLGPSGTFTLGVSVLGAPDRKTTRVTFKQLTGHMLDVQFLEQTANFCDIYDYNIWGMRKGLRMS
jgi:hypothetical protein